MSWLYSFVFAGLLFSSQEGTAPTSSEIVNAVPIPAVSVSTIQDETEKFEQTYLLNAAGRVNVSNVNGSVTIEAWDRNEVKLEYTKVADSKERLADVQIRIESKPEYFSVETDYDSWKSRNGGDRWKNGGKLNVEIRLMVPRGAVLNEIETVNGSVSVSNFVNITRVSAVNGSINATNIRGTAKLSTVNGEVKADFDRLESGSKISLETVNGRVSLVIPSDANATVKAESLNGNITNDFGLPVRKGKYIGRDLYGRLGSGNVQIRLESVNGGLSIGRKNDGKTLSPATDLLPQKQKDGDDDWDNDNEESSFNSAKLDKEIAKAAKVGANMSARVSAQAMADAKAELAQIEPNILNIRKEALLEATNAIERSAELMKSDALMRTAELAKLNASMAELNSFSSIPRVEKKSETFPVKGVPSVTVNAKGCSVSIRGWDKSEIEYRVVQFNDPRNRAAIAMSENHTESTFNLKIENPSWAERGGDFNNSSRRTQVEVFVPRKSNLKISANGEIRLEGVSGEVDLTGSDESINVRDVEGMLKVLNSDGRIRVIGFRGDIVAHSSDGEINLEGDFKSVNATAIDGSILLTLPENASADLEASCDDVEGEGIKLTRISGNDSKTKYRIGNGGPLFQLRTEGEIRIRGAGVLRDSF